MLYNKAVFVTLAVVFFCTYNLSASEEVRKTFTEIASDTEQLMIEAEEAELAEAIEIIADAMVEGSKVIADAMLESSKIASVAITKATNELGVEAAKVWAEEKKEASRSWAEGKKEASMVWAKRTKEASRIWSEGQKEASKMWADRLIEASNKFGLEATKNAVDTLKPMLKVLLCISLLKTIALAFVR